MSKLTDYAAMQKTVYDLYSGDRSQAEAMVAPNYDQAKAQAMQVTAHILDNYRSRANWNVDVSELALQFSVTAIAASVNAGAITMRATAIAPRRAPVNARDHI